MINEIYPVILTGFFRIPPYFELKPFPLDLFFSYLLSTKLPPYRAWNSGVQLYMGAMTPQVHVFNAVISVVHQCLLYFEGYFEKKEIILIRKSYFSLMILHWTRQLQYLYLFEMGRETGRNFWEVSATPTTLCLFKLCLFALCQFALCLFALCLIALCLFALCHFKLSLSRYAYLRYAFSRYAFRVMPICVMLFCVIPICVICLLPLCLSAFWLAA